MEFQSIVKLNTSIVEIGKWLWCNVLFHLVFPKRYKENLAQIQIFFKKTTLLTTITMNIRQKLAKIHSFVNSKYQRLRVYSSKVKWIRYIITFKFMSYI